MLKTSFVDFVVLQVPTQLSIHFQWQSKIVDPSLIPISFFYIILTACSGDWQSQSQIYSTLIVYIILTACSGCWQSQSQIYSTLIVFIILTACSGDWQSQSQIYSTLIVYIILTACTGDWQSQSQIYSTLIVYIILTACSGDWQSQSQIYSTLIVYIILTACSGCWQSQSQIYSTFTSSLSSRPSGWIDVLSDLALRESGHLSILRVILYWNSICNNKINKMNKNYSLRVRQIHAWDQFYLEIF
jgi:uncharacterized membrane protein